MIKTMQRAWQEAMRRQKAMNDYQILQAADERVLRDIGISRGEIDHAIRRLRFRI